MPAKKLHWSDRHFREFVETAPDAKVFVDECGNIVLVNAQAEELFGYPRAEMLGRSVIGLIPPRFHSRLPIPGAPAWSEAHRGLARRGMAIVGLRSDGSEFSAEISIRSLETDQGAIFATAIRDTTDQVLAQENLLKHLSDLAHVSRLSTMGEMVAGLAHELNQPLYGVSNYARACQELARADTGRAAELIEMTDKLLAQAERAGEIVRRLRRFVSRREPRREPVDMNALSREVQQLMLFHSHRFAISLVLSLDEELPQILGDAILLEQVLVNLVGNSFEALSEAQVSQPTVRVETARGAAGMVDVIVADNGPGFKTPDTAQLFEPFYTTKEQGMGLGLVISRSIAEGHGGRLQVVPTVAGAMFRLSLPARTDATGA